ncbi:hypothetical protein SAMN04489712_108187 [Thermomonospora echinospora]|uniref:Uncharacterized protein n=1 Tax=Thermomonospora echinospora TaxID=1992 RepID=A0A1H6C0H3_9ACTN|nr:hypothetical protein [Thermomonospora echinospora]SEG66373.1 hypothetical protein SAMN04489712_108187 [Thermomonospora echinospora]
MQTPPPPSGTWHGRPGPGRSDDPGLWASLSTGTLLGQLRRVMLMLMAAPVLILAIAPMIVREGGSRLGDLPSWVFLPPLAAALVALAAGPRVPRPLDPGPDPEWTGRAAVAAFRQAILLRFALGEAAVMLGLPLAIVARSEMPFLVSFAIGYPLLVWLALPTTGTVERIRLRIEAAGADSRLWESLLAPAGPGPGR